MLPVFEVCCFTRIFIGMQRVNNIAQAESPLRQSNAVCRPRTLLCRLNAVCRLRLPSGERFLASSGKFFQSRGILLNSSRPPQNHLPTLHRVPCLNFACYFRTPLRRLNTVFRTQTSFRRLNAACRLKLRSPPSAPLRQVLCRRGGSSCSTTAGAVP